MEMKEKMRKTIIMVDDNIAELTMGKNALRAVYEVYTAASAKKLFEILESVMPDLIVLDVMMPDMDGYETITTLKKDKRYADIPVVFLTAKDDDLSEVKGFSFGAVDYVPKPFSEYILLLRVTNQITISKQKKELVECKKELTECKARLAEYQA